MPLSGLLSIVIPCYRSEAYLERTVQELVRFFEPHGPFEIILVNDGSPDRVQAVIDRLAAADPRVRFVEHGLNRGQHGAILRGFSMVRGDVVVTLDDDGQNPPEAGLAVAEALQQRGLDVVYGRFRTTEQNAVRRLASRLNRWMSATILGNRTGIALSNVRAVRGDLARALGKAGSNFPYIDAMVFRATRHIGDVPVEHRRRVEGESTYRLSTLVKLWIAHLTTLSVLPLKLATVGCFGVSVFGLVLGVVQLIRALTLRQAPPGWLSLFCALTFLFSLLFAFLGVVSTYVGRLYVTINARGLDWVRSSSSSGNPVAVAVQEREEHQQQR